MGWGTQPAQKGIAVELGSQMHPGYVWAWTFATVSQPLAVTGAGASDQGQGRAVQKKTAPEAEAVCGG